MKGGLLIACHCCPFVQELNTNNKLMMPFAYLPLPHCFNARVTSFFVHRCYMHTPQSVDRRMNQLTHALITACWQRKQENKLGGRRGGGVGGLSQLLAAGGSCLSPEADFFAYKPQIGVHLFA